MINALDFWLPPHPAAGLAYHAIVEDRGCADPLPAIPGGARAVAGTVVCLYHPMGVDTPLDVRAPDKCLAGETTVTAVDRTGGAIHGIDRRPRDVQRRGAVRRHSHRLLRASLLARQAAPVRWTR